MLSRCIHADVSASWISIAGKILFLLEGRRGASNKSGRSEVVNMPGVLNPERESRVVIVPVGLGVLREMGVSWRLREPCELRVMAGLGVLRWLGGVIRGLDEPVQFPTIGFTELADVRCVLLDVLVVFRKVVGWWWLRSSEVAHRAFLCFNTVRI